MNRHVKLRRQELWSAHQRRGVTLTEVLMSLLIMSIGVSLLISLFPLSTLRVIEATNMTNGTVLRYSAEAGIDSNKSLVFDPDTNPATLHLGENYIVDPLGYTVMGTIGGNASVLGYNPPASVTLPLPKRYAGNLDASTPITTVDMARILVTSSDTFTEQGEGELLAGAPQTATSVTLNANVDLSGLSTINLTTTEIRAFIFDGAGNRSETRKLTAISQPAPHTLTWTNPLPSDFGVTTGIGRVMVVSGEEYYTWMLSVHRSVTGPAKVEVVVFVKRLLTEAAEQVYSAKLVPLRPGTTVENNVVTINYSGEKPNIRRGGYIFDTKNCRWYRISSISGTTTTSTTVILENSIQRANTEDLDLSGAINGGEDVNNNGSLDEGGVIVYPNVVGVFPLELKLP